MSQIKAIVRRQFHMYSVHVLEFDEGSWDYKTTIFFAKGDEYTLLTRALKCAIQIVKGCTDCIEIDMH